MDTEVMGGYRWLRVVTWSMGAMGVRGGCRWLRVVTSFMLGYEMVTNS